MSTQTVLRKSDLRGYSFRGYKPAQKGLSSDVAELRKQTSAVNYDVDGDELLDMVNNEMSEFKYTICAAITDMHHSPLDRIIHRVFLMWAQLYILPR